MAIWQVALTFLMETLHTQGSSSAVLALAYILHENLNSWCHFTQWLCTSSLKEGGRGGGGGGAREGVEGGSERGETISWWGLKESERMQERSSRSVNILICPL